MSGREFAKGNFQGNAIFAAGFFEILLALFEAGRLPRFYDAPGDSKSAVGESQRFINFDDSTESAASWAGAEGMIEREEGGRGLVEITLIAWAVVAIREEMNVGGVLSEGYCGHTPSVFEAGGNRFDESGLRGAGEG